MEVTHEMKKAYDAVHGCAETLLHVTNVHSEYLDVVTARHQNELYTSDVMQKKLDEIQLQLHENSRQNNSILDSMGRVVTNQEAILAKLSNLEEILSKPQSNILNYQIISDNDGGVGFQEAADPLIIFNDPNLLIEQSTEQNDQPTVPTQNVEPKKSHLSDEAIDSIISEVFMQKLLSQIILSKHDLFTVYFYSSKTGRPSQN